MFFVFKLLLCFEYNQVPHSSSCFLGDTVFNRGHSIAQRTLASPQICQEWCQVEWVGIVGMAVIVSIVVMGEVVVEVISIVGMVVVKVR